MIAEHIRTGAELRDLLPDDLKSTIPTVLDASSQKKLDNLRDTRVQAFASVYDPMLVSAHKDAVSLFERYAKNGDNDKLRDWAGRTLPALQHYLEMAQALDSNRSSATAGGQARRAP